MAHTLKKKLIYMKKYLLIIILFTNIYLRAQDVPKFEPTNFVDESGKLFWNKALPVYLYLSPNSDGSDAKKPKSEISAGYTNPFYFDTEGKNYMRTHWAVNKDTKKPVAPRQEILWEVYADGVAPKTTVALSEKIFKKVNQKTVYGRNLSIELKSYDATSKVKEIYYSLNGESFRIYGGNLNNFNEGENILKYFAVDNVNNVEEVGEKIFVIDKTPPETGFTITGISLQGNVISASTKIYLNVKDNYAGVKDIYYQIDSSNIIKWKEDYNIPLETLKDGEHSLGFYSKDYVNNVEKEQYFDFYLDRTAPITVSDVLGDKFVVGTKVYFSGRTKMKITSIDNKSGVKQVLYSIDGSEFEDYSDPFYMPNAPGWHVVKYFALDSTENITKDQYSEDFLQYKMKIDKIYVDLSGPSLSHFISGDKYVRGDTTFIGSKSKVNLMASDGESGLQMITYSIDGELKETPYLKPFSLDSLKTGIHKIEYFGYDNVNNRNIKGFEILLDNTGPEIGYKFSVKPVSNSDGLGVYPADTYLFVTAQDDLTGVSSIFYSVNGGQLYVYKNYVKGFKKGENTVKFKTKDKLENETNFEIKFIIE